MLNETIYPRYYPRFDIKRALAFKVQESGNQLKEDTKLPSELVDASSILASELLAQADSLIDQMDEALGELKSCLKKAEFAGMTVDDYERALSEGDAAIADVFEDFHCIDPSGLAQGELYCLFRSLKDRLTHLRGFIDQHIVPVRPKPPARLAEAEERLYTDLAYMEYTNPGSVDRLALAYEAQLKHQVKQRLDYLGSALEEGMAVARSSVRDACRGYPEQVGGDMAAAGEETLEGLKEVLGVTFGRLAADGLQLKEQGRLYGGDEIMRQLEGAAVSLSELRLDAARKVMEWLKSLDFTDESSPAYVLAASALEGLAAIDSMLDTTILDLSKAQSMERMNLEERLRNIRQRKRVRQLISLTDAILSAVDFSRPSEERRRQGEMAATIMANRSTGACTA